MAHLSLLPLFVSLNSERAACGVGFQRLEQKVASLPGPNADHQLWCGSLAPHHGLHDAVAGYTPEEHCFMSCSSCSKRSLSCPHHLFHPHQHWWRFKPKHWCSPLPPNSHVNEQRPPLWSLMCQSWTKSRDNCYTPYLFILVCCNYSHKFACWISGIANWPDVWRYR